MRIKRTVRLATEIRQKIDRYTFFDLFIYSGSAAVACSQIKLRSSGDSEGPQIWTRFVARGIAVSTRGVKTRLIRFSACQFKTTAKLSRHWSVEDCGDRIVGI